MFAVPGWSVSADALKSETQGGQRDGATKAKTRKRKRSNKEEKVTESNVADLYENVIEGKEAKGGEGKRRKSEAGDDGKKKAPKEPRVAAEVEDGSAVAPKPSKKHKKEKSSDVSKAEEQVETPQSGKKDKQQKKDKSKKAGKLDDGEQAAEPQQKSPTEEKKKTKAAAAAIAAAAPPVPPAPAKLTPLQAAMRQKLISARFRHLNETLYTRPSAEAYQLFEDTPEMFSEYHEGFRRQVEVWPENPVDGYIRDIKLRAKQRFPQRPGRPGAQPVPSGPLPLPRTDGTCYIADLGCGDARLASTLQQEARKLHLEILSYDLHSPAKHVTKADIANLPLADGSVDVAIFCLALMGTNWLDFIEEAYRILHWKGELWVAEIKSRFGPVRSKNAVVAHSVGNRKKQAAAGKKGKGSAGEPQETETDRMDLAVEVDGHEDHRGETDVSAFVDALRRRGFVLQGEGEGNRGAVDLSNRMFVKMQFVKAAVPTKGKGVAAAKAAGFVEKEKKQKRFVWKTEEDEVDETGILKPCVYKIR
ncbi:25S rRNA (adenine(645)-N(1))-methyltransferase [Colletotrichum chlorophyti]|uniref:Ribosomal RNA-processing protein 8 n=1 Tax=Colletotrichum chlorophyti TaxID=708187 RepID=A0A1Q8S2F7_9PEZI|nr:25S rRNA (adenine(645)-N(1))-methyltransferase [Colletotrichum chlorophyti]